MLAYSLQRAAQAEQESDPFFLPLLKTEGGPRMAGVLLGPRNAGDTLAHVPPGLKKPRQPQGMVRSCALLLGLLLCRYLAVGSHATPPHLVLCS